MDNVDIPMGNSYEEIVARRQIISSFYWSWKQKNPTMRRYNINLKDFINIRHVSISETCAHSSRSYLSTLAILQLDAILSNAKRVATVRTKGNSNQKMFEKMIVMKYECVGVGMVKMTVGVRRRTHEKVQYCITAIEA